MQNLRPFLTARAEELAQQATTSPVPIWRPVTTREIGRLLGISIQVLANWRVRDQGPPFTHAGRALGRKCLYRMDQVLEWLTGTAAWEFDRSWLVVRGLAPDDADEGYVEWAKRVIS